MHKMMTFKKCAIKYSVRFYFFPMKLNEILYCIQSYNYALLYWYTMSYTGHSVYTLMSQWIELLNIYFPLFLFSQLHNVFIFNSYLFFQLFGVILFCYYFLKKNLRIIQHRHQNLFQPDPRFRLWK